MNYIKDLVIEGGNTGIKGDVSNSHIENVTFRDVKQPFDVWGDNFSIAGTRISETSDFRAAQANRWASEAASGGSKYRLKARDRPLSAPATCPRCGAVFPSKRYTIMNARFYSSSNNQEICPRCGSDEARLAQGLLDLANDTIRLINGPIDTSRMIELLLTYRKEIISKGFVDPSWFLEKLEAAAPGNVIVENSKLHKAKEVVTIISLVMGCLYTLYLVADNELEGPPPGQQLFKLILESMYRNIDNISNEGSTEHQKSGAEHPGDVPKLEEDPPILGIDI